MKIKDLKNLFANVTPHLNPTYEETKAGQSTISKFSNLVKYRSAVIELETSELLQPQIKYIIEGPVFSTAKDSMDINISEGRQLKGNIDQLLTLSNTLSTSFNQLGGDTAPNSLSIRLPDVNDFNDLSEASKDFHKILSQSILDEEIGGEVKITSVENGSIWLEVFVGSSAAVTVIGGLAWAAAVVYKKIQEGRIIEQHVISLKIKNESLKEIQEKQAELLSELVNAEAANLVNENFSDNKPEKIERIKLSIKLLSDLLEKGAEIHPALNQPEKVKNLFPDMKNLLSLESRIKKLEG
jgi:hypothetical protein